MKISVFPRLHVMFLLHIIFNPIDILRDTRVDARITRLTALVAERNYADLRPSTLDFQHQWSTRITLTRILATFCITGA